MKPPIHSPDHGLVILDRDGVINTEGPGYVLAPEDWHALPGSLEAIARLCRAGYLVTVATNQSAVGRRLLSEAGLTAIHERMLASVREAGGEIHGLYYCPHRPEAGCSCRKPASGLYRRILTTHVVPPDSVHVVGDARRDLVPAWELGLRAHLVRTGKGGDTERTLHADERRRTTIHDDLAAFVRDLLDT